MADRTVAVNLIGRAQSLAAAFASGAKGARDFKSELDDLGKKSPQKMHDIAMATGVAGAALLGLAGYAVKASMDFDRQMSEVSAVSNATGKDLTGLRSLAIQAGKDTQYSATEAAKAEAELSKAGVSTADIMGGALAGSLSLAAAGQMDLADAATIAAQTMNIFELKGKDVGHIADVLAQAANTSAADMHGLGQGLQQVGLVAHQAGFSLEETVGVLAAFADRGLQGSDGATSLKTALQRLTAPTSDAKTLMDSLGISVYDTNGNVKDAAGLAGQLQKSLGGLSNEQRNTAMNTIFGADAIRAANVLYSIGESGVRKYTAAVDQHGAAAETARKKTDNLAGDIERLKGSVETLAIEAGSGANGGLRLLVQALDAVVGGFSALPGPVQTSLTVLAGVGGTGLLAVAGLLKVRQTAGDALEALRDMGPAGGRAADGLGRAGKAAGTAALGLGAIALAWEGAQLISHLTGFDDQTRIVTRDVDQMTSAMETFARTGKTTGELQRTFGMNLSDLHRQVGAVDELTAKYAAMQREARSAAGVILGAGGGGPQLAGTSYAKQLAQIQSNIDAADKGLAGLVNNGNATAAKVMLEQLAQAAGMSVDQLLAKLPAYRQAVDGAAFASGGLAKGFGDADTNARTLAGGLEQAMRAGQSLKQVFDQLNGAQINLTQAQINAENAVAAFGKALQDSNGSLDIHNDKGRAAMQTAIDLATKGRDLAQATYDQTHSVKDATDAFNGYRDQLINNIATAGGTREATDESRAAARRLAEQIMQMPDFKAVAISTPGVDAAITRVGTLSEYINGLHDKTVNITTISTAYAQTGRSAGPAARFATPGIERWGGAYEHAAAGTLREAATFSAVSPGRYMIAEPETGGEAFVPRYGDRQRSLGILQKAASWYGTSVGGGDKHMTFIINDATDPSRVVAAIKEYEKANTANWRSG